MARRVILHRRMTSVANGASRKSMGSHLLQRALAWRMRRRPRHRLDSIFMTLWTPAQEASALLGVEVGWRAEVVGSPHGSVVVF
jgi:hypothetical protein